MTQMNVLEDALARSAWRERASRRVHLLADGPCGDMAVARRATPAVLVERLESDRVDSLDDLPEVSRAVGQQARERAVALARPMECPARPEGRHSPAWSDAGSDAASDDWRVRRATTIRSTNCRYMIAKNGDRSPDRIAAPLAATVGRAR